MAITNATRVADFGSGIGTAGSVLKVDNTNKRIGIGTTIPNQMLQVGTAVSVYGNSGIVSATEYYGDGSNLTGITGGATLSAGSGAQRVVVTSLTSGTMTAAATDAELTYNSDTDTLSATTFSGALSGNASGLTGSPNITINNLVGVAATFSGVLSYEDVTNIDSVGVVTAGKGFRATTGGLIVTAGVSTFPQSTTITAKTGGQVLVGTSAEATIGGYTWNGLQVRSTTGGSAIVFEEFNTSNWMAGLKFGKSRASSIGSYTIVQDGDNLGNLIWHGADGTDMACQAASIQVEVDGTPGSDDMPGRIKFATTADGAASPTERMRITAGGQILVNTSNNGSNAEYPLIVSGRANDATDSGRVNIKRGEAAASMSAGDSIGDITFTALDGGNAAQIAVKAGTGWGGTSDSPGELIFHTTPDGSGTLAERMRLTSNGGLLLSNGILVERCKIVTTAWSTTNDISLDDGNVFLNTANLAGTNNYLDITSSNGISNDLAVGDMTSVTCITAVNAATAYIDAITVGGANVTESWVGGSAPTDGGSSGYDVYTFNIIKTAATPTYVVIANQVKGS